MHEPVPQLDPISEDTDGSDKSNFILFKQILIFLEI